MKPYQGLRLLQAAVLHPQRHKTAQSSRKYENAIAALGVEDSDGRLWGGGITGYYALDYGEWQKIGTFGNYFDFLSVGMDTTNSVPEEWEVDNIESRFDYFEIALP